MSWKWIAYFLSNFQMCTADNPIIANAIFSYSGQREKRYNVKTIFTLYIQNLNFFLEVWSFLASSKFWDRTRTLGTLSETKIQFIRFRVQCNCTALNIQVKSRGGFQRVLYSNCCSNHSGLVNLMFSISALIATFK